jgi:hypothetical protein
VKAKPAVVPNSAAARWLEAPTPAEPSASGCPAERQRLPRRAARPRQRDEGRERLRGHGWVDGEHHRLGRDLQDRGEVAHRVVGQARQQRRVHHVRDGGEQQGVAVGRGAGDVFGADRGGGAGAILDDDGLAPGLEQLLRQAARDEVHRPAGGDRDDDAYGALGPAGLGLGDAAAGPGEEGAGEGRSSPGAPTAEQGSGRPADAVIRLATIRHPRLPP